MGLKPSYNTSWNKVYAFLKDPGNTEKYREYYSSVEPLIKYWLLTLGLNQDLDGHAKSVFSDLYLKEQKRFQSGKLVPEKCTALITSYYFPVIKNLCIDYTNTLSCKLPFKEDVSWEQKASEPGVFETLWGEHKNTVLAEMSRSVKDWIELSNFDPARKEYLRKRYIDGHKLPEIIKGVEKSEFEAQRKWICRQGKKIAQKIARSLLPAIIDCYKLPINKTVDPKIIEKHLLGLRTKLAI
ncbi:hypothetical protein [Muriicola sp. Z0-33]|uniref:hypothetical protein n=1 Tax=Muriicola sp. Z0-33 TaxID=2816957 RepID=UPI0022386685|nr:hypothetical protein [Muriicola sp. Z0-33]MCW5514772.1 hypothetical protein [Muriicola sp. Z0-33]